jgi:hypothetical protein
MYQRRPLPPDIAAALGRLLASLKRHDARIAAGINPLQRVHALALEAMHRAARPVRRLPVRPDKSVADRRRRSVDQVNAELASLARTAGGRNHSLSRR